MLYEGINYDYYSAEEAYAIITVTNKDRTIHYSFIDNKREIYHQYIEPIIAPKRLEEKNNKLEKVILTKQNKNEKKKNVNKVLKAADFLVRTTNYQCTNRTHDLVRINAIVRVMKRDEIIEVELPAYYCEICNRYYILENDYNQLKRYGYICCRIDTFESLINPNNNPFGGLKDKSLLMNYGYRVDKKTGLSEKQRQDILSFMIDNGIITKSEIINHLTFLVSMNKKKTRNYDAVQKWKNDIRFVQNHEKVKSNVYTQSIKVPIMLIS